MLRAAARRLQHEFCLTTCPRRLSLSQAPRPRLSENASQVQDAPPSGNAATWNVSREAPVLHKTDRSEQKKRDKRLKKIDDEIGQLESRIASAEGERERNDLLLCSEEVFRDGERSKKIQTQNADLKSMIELLYRKWEDLSKEKEDLEATAGSSRS